MIRIIRKYLGTGTRVLKTRILALIAPVSEKEDRRRQELILNIILIASILLLVLFDGIVIFNTIRLRDDYGGISWVAFSSFIPLCLSMFIASKRGHARTVSYIIIFLYSAGAIYTGWHWGISLPITLLSFALISITASILISSNFGFMTSGFLIISLAVLSIHEIYSLKILPWKYKTLTTTDIVTYGTMLLFIAVLSWLSNREIKISLDRARLSEQKLAAERDLLEIKIQERTRDLYKAQTDRMEEISQIAEFGRLSQGLFHDLMTPLSSVALNMEKIRNADSEKIAESRAYLDKAIAASQKMGNLMNTIRDYIKQSSIENRHTFIDSPQNVLIETELSDALELLKYKAREADVSIRSITKEPVIYRGNPIHFQRIFLNLISNAIEAHEEKYGSEKIIDIEIKKHLDNITITVSDNGPGIKPGNIPHIFDPFFTTKSADKGIGVGLSTVKNIVENNIEGTICVESKTGQGSRFTISFPRCREK